MCGRGPQTIGPRRRASRKAQRSEAVRARTGTAERRQKVNMGEVGGFKKFDRRKAADRAPGERVRDHFEFVRQLPLVELREQGARCMECGVPFCHHGCPLGNLIPDWNDLVYRDRWREAIDQLHRTNNFPEFTGRLCPAPCEAACVLEIEESNAVTIKQIELAIVSRAWRPTCRSKGASFAVCISRWSTSMTATETSRARRRRGSPPPASM